MSGEDKATPRSAQLGGYVSTGGLDLRGVVDRGADKPTPGKSAWRPVARPK